MAKKRKLSFARIIGGGLVSAARVVRALYGRETGTNAVAYAAWEMPPIVTADTPKGTLRFWCPSPSAAKRALKFSRSEPDTRDWIDTTIQPSEHVWDVGANIGAYALYACLRDKVTVTAFEPVAGTFAILTRNVAVNGLETRITPLCMALSNADGLVPIYLASTEPGAAMHALSAPENARGRFEAEGRQTILALRGDDIVQRLGVPKPDHIKIDVDGHELRVLEGLVATLASVRTLWIEMVVAADASGENARIEAFLTARGFEHRNRPDAPPGRNRCYVNKAKAGI